MLGELLEKRALLAATPVTSSSVPEDFVDLDGTAYFAADDGIHGRELWRSDGTEAGTTLVVDRNPGPDGGLYNLKIIDNALFFQADGGVWTSDGTANGTRKVADGVPLWFDGVKVGDYYWGFRGGANRGLYRSDGTDEGTVLIKAFNDVRIVGSIGDSVVYSAHPWHTNEYDRGYFYLWASGGAAGQATSLSPDIVTHHTSSQPNGMTLGDELFFVRYNGLYKTDGSANSLVRIFSMPGNVRADLAQFDGTRLLLYGSTAAAPDTPTLWVTDGTIGGTQVLRQFSGGMSSNMIRVGQRMYFFANDEQGHALWSTDGTPAGTQLVKAVTATDLNRYTYQLVAAEDLLYFTIDNGDSYVEWRSDATEAGTVPVADITNFGYFGAPAIPVAVGRDIYYSLTDGYAGLEPWILDAAGVGVRLVKDINTGALTPPWELALSTDSGRSPWDNITRTNPPTIRVSGDYVARHAILYMDGVEVARDTSSFGGFYFNQLPPLLDGPHVVTAAIAGADGVFTALSDPLNIVIDTVAPTVVTSSFRFNALRQPQISFQFSEDVFQTNPSLWLRLRNLDTGSTVNVSIDQITRDTTTNTVTFTLLPPAGGLPPAHYRATLEYSNVEDLAGNKLTGDVFNDFVVRETLPPPQSRVITPIDSVAALIEI